MGWFWSFWEFITREELYNGRKDTKKTVQVEETFIESILFAFHIIRIPYIIRKLWHRSTLMRILF